MSQPTEAEILLDAGVLYGKRLLFRRGDGDPIFVGFKPGAFSVYYGDAPFYHFDLEGRWQRVLVEGVHFLKGLDTTVQAIDRVREGKSMVLKRRTLTHAEADWLDEAVRVDASELLEQVGAERLERAEPSARGVPIPREELRWFLNRVESWDALAWQEHRSKYDATYGVLPFVPPDCPSPVILQATVGHEHARTFGGISIVEHAPRTPATFEEHVKAVVALLGRRVEQCKTVFLGGADVLRRPLADVAAFLAIAVEFFAIDVNPERKHPDPSGNRPHRLDGIHAFLDDFGPSLPFRDDWKILRRRGLVRVSVGIESGDPAVRKLYHKNWTDDALIGAVADMKAAGIGVSPIVLLGAGGTENDSSHVSATSALVARLELGPGDLVSLIDAEELRTRGEAVLIEPMAFTPLRGPALDAQRDDFKARLTPTRASRKAKVAAYSMEKQGTA